MLSHYEEPPNSVKASCSANEPSNNKKARKKLRKQKNKFNLQVRTTLDSDVTNRLPQPTVSHNAEIQNTSETTTSEKHGKSSAHSAERRLRKSRTHQAEEMRASPDARPTPHQTKRYHKTTQNLHAEIRVNLDSRPDLHQGQRQHQTLDYFYEEELASFPEERSEPQVEKHLHQCSMSYPGDELRGYLDGRPLLQQTERHNQSSKNNTGGEEVRAALDAKPASQQANIRFYLDKLREIVPHVPKQGKVPRLQLIQRVIDHICDLQQTLEDHPRLKGIDPRIIAAPGNRVSPLQIQQELIQQQQLQMQQQIQMQQNQLLQGTTPHYGTPYTRKPLCVISSGNGHLSLQARREAKMARLHASLVLSSPSTTSNTI